MRSLYVSESGGGVVADYEEPTSEEHDNLEAARYIADLGKMVVLVKPSNLEKTADALIDGIPWEIKTNRTPTKSAIDHALRTASKQSRKMILNVKSDISEKELDRGIKGRLFRTNLEEVLVIFRKAFIKFEK